MSKLQILIFSGISILLIVIGKTMENNYSLKSGVAILAIMSFITGYNMVFQNRIDLFEDSGLKKEDLDNFEKLDTDTLREELLKFSGVGNKVADCIMLFSYRRGEVFPVDVWIKRVMEELFIKEETPVKKISKEADRIFGKYAGYAQQYLFYYGREEKIGK